MQRDIHDHFPQLCFNGPEGGGAGYRVNALGDLKHGHKRGRADTSESATHSKQLQGAPNDTLIQFLVQAEKDRGDYRSDQKGLNR